VGSAGEQAAHVLEQPVRSAGQATKWVVPLTGFGEPIVGAAADAQVPECCATWVFRRRRGRAG
jgi:hypothetical protein